MIYWLCLICCIQSSYYASPLIRTKHEMHDAQTNQIDTDLQNEFQPIHFKNSAKNVRSFTERFPWMKNNFNERATDKKSNTISGHRFFIRAPNVYRNPNTKRARNQNSSKTTKSAVPEIKPYDPNKDSTFTQNPKGVEKKAGNLNSRTESNVINSTDENLKATEKSQFQNHGHLSNHDDNQLNVTPHEYGVNVHQSPQLYDDTNQHLHQSDENDRHPIENRRQHTQNLHKQKKHHSLGGKYGHKPGKESDTQNEKREPEPSIKNRDNLRKPKISDGSTDLGLSNHGQEANRQLGGGSWLGGVHDQKQTGETNGNGQFTKNFDLNSQKEEKLSPNIESKNNGAKMEIRHHKKSPKKKHDKKHHFAGIDTKSPDKKYIPSIFQSERGSVNKPTLNEISNPIENYDNQNVQDFPWNFIRAPRPESSSMNPPETHEIYQQNDSLQDQQPSDSVTDQRSNSKNLPFFGEVPDNPEEQVSHNEPEVSQEEQVDRSEEMSMQYPSQANGNFKQNGMQQDLQMDEASLAQNNLQNSVDNEKPMDYDYISDYAGSKLQEQDSETSTVGSTEESTELYKPIRFKLGESSQSIRRSMSNYTDTDSQRIAKEAEFKNTNDKNVQVSNGNRDASENETTHFRNEKQIHSDPFYFSTTDQNDEVSPIQFITTQQVNHPNSTSPHNLKKKSNSFEYYNKYPMEPKDNFPYQNFRKEELYFPHKRSDQHLKSSSSIARRNNELREFDTNANSMSKKEFSPDHMEFQGHNDINFKYPYKKDLYHKRDENSITTTTVASETDTSSSLSQKENSSKSIASFANQSQTPGNQTETSTSIIQEYAMPTLGVPNKIMKSLAENQKRSSSQNYNPNVDTLHTDSMHFRNTKYVPLNEQNHIYHHEPNVRSNNAKQWKRNNPLTPKIIRNTVENSYSTQYPGQIQKITDKYQSENMFSNKPNATSISKRDDPEGNIVDEVTRTYEGLKTKQTIVKDSLTNKETNVIENQKEKIVDSIHLTKQSKLMPPSKNSEEQNEDNATEQVSDDEDYYPNEYENGENGDYKENAESYSEESGIIDEMNPQKTEEMYYDADGNFVDKKEAWYSGVSGDRPNGTLDISVNRKSNTFKTDEFKKPPVSNYYDSPAAENNEKSPNAFETNPRPFASKTLPRPMTYKSQDLNAVKNFGANEMRGETEQLEPSNGDEYPYQEPIDESESGEQSSFLESQYNKDIPEQSTDNFIDLGEQEEKKENILEDLDKFPTAKLNSKPRDYQPNAAPDRRGQQENQRNFYEFSTILPNANNIGEFQREEKVERQSKVILKNNGIVTNGTSCLFGEKKMEVKDNKQNYHEAYMEEKGESKFPNEDSEKQKRDGNSSEESVKVRQIPGRVFPRQDNKENNQFWESNSNLLKPWNLDTDKDERSQSIKNKKNAYYTDDESYNEYYFATEDNPESMMDPEDRDDDEDYEEYVMNPKDVLQNDGSIDGISKRSGALIDISKLMKNGKSLRSSELPTGATREQQRDNPQSTEIGFGSDPIITTTAFDEQSLRNREHGIGIPNKIAKNNANAVTNKTSEESSNDHNNNEQKSLGSHMSNRQIEQNILPNNSSGESSNLNQDTAKSRDLSIEHKRDDNPTEMSPRSVNTGSGNIVYVTVSSTTDKESKFHDFLQIQEVGRQSRQSRRHPGDVYRRQKKHSPRQKASKFLTNYRINRSSNYN